LPQLVPFATLVHAVVLVLGWHVWQGLLGFTPGESNVPAMKQPEAQLVPLHTSPVAQLVPVATAVHWLVLVAG